MRRNVSTSNEAGWVLLLVLLFMQAMAIMGCYAIESAKQAQKISRLEFKQHQLVWIAAGILKTVEAQVQDSNKSCYMPVISSAELVAKSNSWWQSPERCAGIFQSFKYYYVVEEMAQAFCATEDITSPNEEQSRQITYERVTVLMLDSKSQARDILQNNFIALDNGVQDCMLEQHVVQSGWQAWREL